jgi:hypothetical protein
MGFPIIQPSWHGYRVDSLRPDKVLDIKPGPGLTGERLSYHLSEAWSELGRGRCLGVLLLGSDVAADPDDYLAMRFAVMHQPHQVHAGLVKLWPASTGRPEWVWSHRGGKLGNPEAGRLDIIHPTYFALEFTYIPRILMDLAFPAHDDWSDEDIAEGLSEMALQHHIRVNVVYEATPKNLNFRVAQTR